MKKYLNLEVLTYFLNHLIDKFVAKEDSKGLSTNDYTNEDKDKLNNINAISIGTIDTICNAEIYKESEITI